MYRSWSYILMIVATLIGVVALLWPTPQVREIEEIAMVTREPAPRADTVKPAKPAGKPAQGAKPGPKPAPPPPAVVKQIPPQNTTTRRGAAVPQNGLQPNMFGRPVGEVPEQPEPAKPAGGITARPLLPPRPPAPARANPAAERQPPRPAVQ